MRARVPRAVAEDHEIDIAVTVDIGQQRHVAGQAAEDVRRIRDAILVEVDGPDAGPVGDDVGNAIAVHVGGEHIFRRRRKIDLAVRLAAAFEFEQQRTLLRAVYAEVERKLGVCDPRAQGGGESEHEEDAAGPVRQGRCRIVGRKEMPAMSPIGNLLLIGRRA
jgi:hypothetical protein